MNTRFQRSISLLLALVMVISFLPVSAFAAGSTAIDAAIIFTDLHTSSSNYKESTVKNIMTAFKNTGLPFSLVISGGDAFSVNADNTKYTGDPTKITGYIQNVLGNIPVHYVWSDHDRYGTGIDKNSGFVYGAGADGVYGTADDGNYYVYSLSMADLSTNDRYSSGFHSNAQVTATIAAFVADAAKLDQSKPLLIASHQPLFDRRDDNGHALEWCNAINQVAETMDVAFFFGHNHRYDQAGDYYYAKGSTMAVTKSDLSSQNVKLNFTHLCGGYLEPSSTGSTSSTTRQGTAMAVAIYEDSIRYTTYNSSGVYTGTYAVDVTVPRDFAVTEPELVVSGTASYFTGDALDLTVTCKTGSKTEDVTAKATLTGYDMNNAGAQTVQISYNGLTASFQIQVFTKVFTGSNVTVEVQTPGATAMTVGNVSNASAQTMSGLLGSQASWNIAMANYPAGSLSTVTLPVPGGVTTPAVYRVSDDGSTVTRLDVTKSADGKTVSFTTTAFGNFFIGQEVISEDLENTLVAGGTSYADKTVYVKVDAFENGGRYLIIGQSKASGGDLIAYLNNNGSEGWQTVTVNAASITANGTTYSKGYIELSNSGAVWTAASASSGYTLTNNGRYIGGTDANTLKSSSSDAAKVTYDASAARLKTASGTTRYLYYSTYNSENWKWSTSSSSSTSSRNMWIYKEVTVQVPTSTQVVYNLQAENLAHVLTTNTAQLNFSLLADGAAVALPAGAACTFQVVNDENGIISSISDTGLVTFNRAAGSCYVKIACTWSEGTVYKYVKVTAEADPNACDHTYTAETVQPTCTADGFTTYTCVCGDTYTEVIPASGHNYKFMVTAPSCTAGGYTTHTCDSCGDSYTTDATAALGHTYTSVTVKATCTTDGYTTYTCACGHSYTDVIPASGHSYKSVVTAPSCTAEGYTTHTCDNCGDSYTTDATAALGHSYKTVTVKATCTTDGSVTHTCACGDSFVEVIPATGHDYTATVTAPTCEAGGFTTHTCGNCGDAYVTDEISALGHSYKTAILDATCAKDGSIIHTCTACGHSYAEVIPATGHNHSAVVTAPTCTADGFTTYTCGTCGGSYVSDRTAALGHNYASVTVEASCTTDGSVTYTCTTCGNSYAEVIKATGHDYTAVVTAPTCETAGYTTNTCSTCGHTYVSDEVAALGHTYESVTVNATCTTDGSATYTCACGDSYAEVIPATGHDYTAVVTAPTCTEAGFTTHTCACGDSYVDSHVNALGHSYETVTVDATCTEGGYTTRTCTACGDSSVTGETPALGHDYVSATVEATCVAGGYTTHTCGRCDDTYTDAYVKALGHRNVSVVTAATCETAGYTTHTCSVCGHETVDSHVAALGHDWNTVTVDATCTTDGSVTNTCGRCGEKAMKVIAALGHDYTAVVTAPTCTEAGFTTNTCERCGHSYTSDEVAALGHDHKAVTVNATCTADGSVTYTCACGDSYVEVIPATGHDYTAVVTAPTCTEAGFTTNTCANCGHSYTSDEVAALGHDHKAVTVNATCTADGSVTYTCACGDSYAEVIKATGHNYSCVETDGALVYTCGNCGDSYSEIINWIALSGTYVLDTDGIDIGSAHKYIVVGSSNNYALTRSGSSIGSTAVTIVGNTITLDNASACEFYFADNSGKESGSYLLTQDGTNTVYHRYGGMYYGNDNKGYWHIGSGSNGAYQIYDSDWGTWYLNYGYVWGSNSTNNFAVSSNARTVRLFKATDSYVRLAGSMNQTYTEACGTAAVTEAAVLEKLSVQVSANGSTVSSTKAVTSDMVTWNKTLDGNTAGTYTATVTYQGAVLGTVTVTVTAKHAYETVTVAPTCVDAGHNTRTCANCGHSTVTGTTAALGHDYTCTESGDSLVYTCNRCGDSYAQAIAWTAVSNVYVLDTDGIEIGSSHKYLVVGSNADYALTRSGNNTKTTAVKVVNNTITLSNSNCVFYFADNSSRESGSYLLTQDGNKTVYHVSSNIKYGNDSKGYWHIGSSNNGHYQLYDNDNCAWYLNYGQAWGTDSASRFAVSYNGSNTVRLFKAFSGYIRLTGAMTQTASAATESAVLEKLTIQTSSNGSTVDHTVAVTADMVTWNTAFNGSVPGTYTGTVTYMGQNLGTITVTITG